MAFCVHCGAAAEAEANFCTSCGARLEVPSPAPAAPASGSQAEVSSAPTQPPPQETGSIAPVAISVAELPSPSHRLVRILGEPGRPVRTLAVYPCRTSPQNRRRSGFASFGLDFRSVVGRGGSTRTRAPCAHATSSLRLGPSPGKPVSGGPRDPVAAAVGLHLRRLPAPILADYPPRSSAKASRSSPKARHDRRHRPL